jgi:hypothetical protein
MPIKETDFRTTASNTAGYTPTFRSHNPWTPGYIMDGAKKKDADLKSQRIELANGSAPRTEEFRVRSSSKSFLSPRNALCAMSMSLPANHLLSGGKMFFLIYFAVSKNRNGPEPSHLLSNTRVVGEETSPSPHRKQQSHRGRSRPRVLLAFQ